MELLIKSARVIDWSQDFIGDVYINDGKISEIGATLEKNCKTVDGTGYVLMPAFTDLHCHFRDPGFTHKEDIESGSKAAVKGGYTTVNLMGNTKPICSSLETVAYVKEKAKSIGLIDVNQVISITENFDGKTTTHLEKLTGEIKFISDDGVGVEDSKVMYEAMVKAKEIGLGIMSHCEDKSILSVSSRLAENMMTIRDIILSKYTGCRLHLSHVSTKEAINYIKLAKKEGVPVTCEVTPHHIALTGEGTYRVNPPIREEEDRVALIQAIKDGYVDAIGTDHAPHTKEDKANGSPGLVGIETAFSVCYTKLVKDKHISINKLSEIMSKNPSEILKVNKGTITIGKEGDLVLVDLNKEIEIDANSFVSKGKNTPFHGMKFFGEVQMTIKAGKIVYSKL
ncbi:dihydroorotase [Clostridium cellulovorans]|uniref:Dihydroorotase n=1 Tax=Clostridium cellulovorans (strain ATCC 35296 / DSM 3052 / OCM 3 / 743B) TaxID=573061 RepID=D9SWU1_CLOC7|nr:dihydroorotase [Clostridium cellulovorans]ADL51302.1 dihydroorotase, multifunctional complex type [Clostridium cellulovorans 743B]